MITRSVFVYLDCRLFAKKPFPCVSQKLNVLSFCVYVIY